MLSAGSRESPSPRKGGQRPLTSNPRKVQMTTMAKRILSTVDLGGIQFSNVEVDVKDGEKTFPVQYQIPANPQEFAKWVQNLSVLTDQAGKDDLEKVYDRYCYAHDLKCRASERESASVILPIITTKRFGKVNLVSGEYGAGIKGETDTGSQKWDGNPVPLANRLAAINGAYQGLNEPSKAIQAARAQLLEQKIAKEQGGVLRPA